MNILAYHGTDYNIAKLIITQGFTFNKNPEHWLGNGIYLYQDYSLAKWWTTNPTKKFGNNVKERAIVTCNICLDENKIINLLKLDDYCQFSNIFEENFYPRYKEQHPINPPSWTQLRCAYCDYLNLTYELDAIIGNFNKQDQPYLPPIHNNEFDDFLLQYTEVQICVFNKNIISDIKIEKI